MEKKILDMIVAKKSPRDLMGSLKIGSIEASGLEDLREALGQAAWGRSPREARALGLCPSCGEEALPKCYSPEGRREVEITGLCEPCWDKLFEEAEEEILQEEKEDVLLSPEGAEDWDEEDEIDPRNW
jgi:hypothetical protein